MHTVELTDDELRLVREAVRAFLGDFGNDQRELVRSLVAILQKLDLAEAAPAASAR